MNEVLNAILTRRSVRSYKPDPVPEDVLERILTAGQYAASGMNRQRPIILAVTNKAVRARRWCWWCWRTRPRPPISTTAAW